MASLSCSRNTSIAWIRGTARLAGSDGDAHRVEISSGDGNTILTAPRILIATGSDAVELPFMKFDGNIVVSARDALAFDRVPEHLLVVGAGYIGLELGSVWRRLGAQVTVVEVLPRMLPTMDGQAADTLQRSLKKQGIAFRMDTRVTGCTVTEGKARVTVESGGDGRKSPATRCWSRWVGVR